MRTRVSWAILALLVVVSGCNRNNNTNIINITGPSDVTAPGAGPAPELRFTASPGTIDKGGSSTLRWETENVTTCTASGGWSGSKAASGGTQSVSPNSTTTYNLSCNGPGGTIGKSVTVEVKTSDGPSTTQPTLSFSVSPTAINQGQYATLNWNSQYTTTCTASGGWSGTKSTTGSESVSPSSTTTYTLTCNGPGGSVTKSTTLTVNQQSQQLSCTLSANPTTITAGQSVVLTWDSAGATSVTRSWNSSNTGDFSGTNTVSPSSNTTYSVVCAGPGGSLTRTVTVTVNQVQQQPPSCQLSGSSSVNSGQTYNLNWTSSNATSWSTNWGGSVTQATGSTTLNAPAVSSTQTINHVLTCNGPGGTSTSSWTVTVNPTTTPPSTCAGASAALPSDGSYTKGSSQGFNISAPSGCQWSLTSNNHAKVSANPAQGTGSGFGSLAFLNVGSAQVCFVAGGNQVSCRNYTVP